MLWAAPVCPAYDPLLWSFWRREHDNMGQKWISGWHPTSVLLKDYTLNIYGGRNGEGNEVGLYPMEGGSGKSNEEWRRKDKPGEYLGQPECIQITYGQAEYTKGPGEVQEIFMVSYKNLMDKEQEIKINYEEKKVKETNTSHTVDVNFGSKLSAKLTAGGEVGIPFVSKGKVEAEVGQEFTFNAG